MIRLKNNNVELLLPQEPTGTFMYGRKVIEEDEEEPIICYIIDLTNKRFLAETSEDHLEMDWNEEVEGYIRESKRDCVIYLNNRIENNRNVILSTTNEGNAFETAKAQKHLEKNRGLLTFIQNYEI